jgi:hypothetical protein
MGALTITINRYFTQGNLRGREITLSPSTSYAAGGETYTEQGLGLFEIVNLQVFPDDGLQPEVDYTNKKVKVMQPVQIEHNAAPDATTVRLKGAGTPTAFEQNITAAANVNFLMKEAIAAADHSAAKFRGIVIGY